MFQSCHMYDALINKQLVCQVDPNFIITYNNKIWKLKTKKLKTNQISSKF